MEEERREKETHETEAATSDSCHSRMKRPLHTEGAPVGLLRWQEAALQEVREMKNGCTAETEHEQEATWRKNSLRRSRKRSKKWMNAPVFPTCKEKRSVRSKTMGTHTRAQPAALQRGESDGCASWLGGHFWSPSRRGSWLCKWESAERSACPGSQRQRPLSASRKFPGCRPSVPSCE